MLYVTRYINEVLALILLSINDGSPKVSVSRKDPSVNSQQTEIVGNIKECIELSKLDDHRGHDSQYAGTSCLEVIPLFATFHRLCLLCYQDSTGPYTNNTTS